MLPGEGRLKFVVHKHRATSLHYDFRLEIGGVMPSWSIPKGPTLDSRVRRLAMPTGDHDLEYAKFEGVIRKGSYGAGAVMIWDSGTYNMEVENEKGERRELKQRNSSDEAAKKGLAGGMLKFVLYGRKLKGSFALVRTRGIGGKEAWLMIKHRDAFTSEGFDAKDHGKSVASGRTIEEIEGQEEL